MELVVVRHVPFEDVGHIEPILAERGDLLRFCDLGQPIELAGASGLILMGGPMSANDGDPWVAAELAAIDRALKAGMPVLGICLGAQLIAKALGAKVYRNAVKEIGWFPVYWQEAAAADPLFESLSGPDTVFHWHGETFELPRGAAWLASSDRCAYQAFRWGDRVYALQFHLEVTPDMVADWCAQDANCGDVRELREPIDAQANAALQAELARLVFGRWAERVLRLPRL